MTYSSKFNIGYTWHQSFTHSQNGIYCSTIYNTVAQSISSTKKKLGHCAISFPPAQRALVHSKKMLFKDSTKRMMGLDCFRDLFQQQCVHRAPFQSNKGQQNVQSLLLVLLKRRDVRTRRRIEDDKTRRRSCSVHCPNKRWVHYSCSMSIHLDSQFQIGICTS